MSGHGSGSVAEQLLRAGQVLKMEPGAHLDSAPVWIHQVVGRDHRVDFLNFGIKKVDSSSLWLKRRVEDIGGRDVPSVSCSHADWRGTLLCTMNVQRGPGGGGGGGGVSGES